MEQILFATERDIPHIFALMNNAVSNETPKDWYVTDDEEFIGRHLGSGQTISEQVCAQRTGAECNRNVSIEGYTLKYIIDNELAAFLIVRHPGEAEDNLGRELLKQTSANTQQVTAEFLSGVAHMESAAVHPDYRGKGLQGRLLKHAEEIERIGGTRFLMATVHPDNIFSLRNLEAAGYECILETEKYGGLRRKVLCKELKADFEGEVNPTTL